MKMMKQVIHMNRSILKIRRVTFFYMKRNKWSVLVWLLLLTVLTAIVPPAFQEMYPNKAKMNPIIQMSENPAMKAMLGPGKFEDTNVGVLFAHEMTLFTGILVAIMSILFVAKNSRGDEADGKLEMMMALPIRRQVILISNLINGIVLNLLLGCLLFSVLLFSGNDAMDANSALVYSLSMSAFGILFVAITLMIAQLVLSASQVSGVSIGLLLIMYFIRAIGDTINVNISLLSPLGWLSRVYAYSENNSWPLLLMTSIAIILIFITVYLYHIRDIDEAFIHFQGYRRRALGYMKSPLGLQIKLQKKSLMFFGSGLFLLGLSYGSIFGELDEFFKDNAMLQAMLTNKSGSYAEQFLPQLMMIMAMVSTIPTLIALLRVKKEIDKGYALAVLARPVSRIKYLMSFFIISSITAIVMMFLAGLGLYVGTLYSMDNPLKFGIVMGAALVYIPAILLFIGIGMLVIGCQLKLYVLLYTYLVYAFLVNYLGVLLNVQDWMKEITPYEHIPNIPVDDMNWLPLVFLFVIYLVLSGLGFWAFKFGLDDRV